MNPNNDEYYDDYSALDAPDRLYRVLTLFFQHKQNAYKFASAIQHFDNINKQDMFVDASCLFKFLTGTDLIKKKHVLHYRTARGIH